MKYAKQLRGIFCLSLLLMLSGLRAESNEISDEEALLLGRQVLAVKAALQDPEAEGALETVTALGNDSRYYVMVRGWVVQHIQMAESYRGTSDYKNNPQRRLEVEKKISALQGMLRRLDLE